MKRKTVVTTAAAAALAATLVIGGTYAYLTDSSGVTTNIFAENGNDVELDETTGSDYDIIPGTEQEKDPTIMATYTLDSYVYVEVTDKTGGLVEWYIANGWSELEDYENVYAMELRTIYNEETWTLVEDGESDYNGQFTYTDDNGIVYYYDATTGEYTAIIPVLKDNKVSYSADITNEDMKVGETVELSFQAYIMQMSGFDSADDAYFETATVEISVGGSKDTALTQLQDALDENDIATITLVPYTSANTFDLSGEVITANVSKVVIDFQNTKTYDSLNITGGTVTLKGDYSSYLQTDSTKATYGGYTNYNGNLYIDSKSGKTFVTVTGDNSKLNVESGRYAVNKGKDCTMFIAEDNATIRISGGDFYSRTTGTSYSTKFFYALDGGVIYVDDVDSIIIESYLDGQTIFTAENNGVIYVAKDVYEACKADYPDNLLGSGCSAEYDADTGYYVISAN